MEKVDSVIAIFESHQAAEAAVKELAATGFDVKNFTIAGRGFHTDETAIGFYNIGDRIKVWGVRGAFLGGVLGLLFGRRLMSVPVAGRVFALGNLASIAIPAIKNALVAGGLSALGAALYSAGVPKDSVIQYETALKADSFLVIARGTAGEVARAKAVLDDAAPSSIDVHAAAL